MTKVHRKKDFLKKLKNGFLKMLKVMVKALIVFIKIVSFVAFVGVPFLYNCIDNEVAQWIWYIAGAVLIVWFGVDRIINKQPWFETPIFELYSKWGEFIVFPIFASIFVFNYYEIDYIWMWVIFGVIALCIPIFLLSLFRFQISNNETSEELRQHAAVNVVKQIFLYWFLDLLYMSIFNDWTIFIFIFGVLSLIIIFLNLANAFLNSSKELHFFLSLEMIIALVLSGYLIFIIENVSIRTITLTMVAALYGGILTLIGVAWTIKDSEMKRNEDLSRVENERKEEERKRIIPYLTLANNSTATTVARIAKIENLNFSKASAVSKIIDDTYYVIKIDPFNIKNVSQSIIILKGVSFDDVYYKFEHDILIEKDGICQIQVGINHWFAFPRKLSKVRLFTTDVLSNIYTIECEMYGRCDNMPGKNVAPNGIEYIICSYTYTAEMLLLPEYRLQKNDG